MRQKPAVMLKTLLALGVVCALLVVGLPTATLHVDTGTRYVSAALGGDTSGAWEYLGAPLSDNAISGITIDPEDEHIWYVGSFSNGLYITRDGGTNWEQHLKVVDSDPLNVAAHVGAIAIDPNNHRTVYANRNADLYKSVDQGENWFLVGSFPSSHDKLSGIESILVRRSDEIVIVGLGSQYVDRGAASGIYRSRSRSSDNMTLAFDCTSTDNTVKGIHYWDIQEDPVNGYVYFCTEVQDTYVHHNPVMKSVDGGLTWTDISPANTLYPGTYNPHCIAIAVHPLTRVLYVKAENESLFSSIDFGSSWKEEFLPFAGAFIIDKNHPNRFYGTELVSGALHGGVYFSEDAGESFSLIGLDNKENGAGLALNGTGTRLLATVWQYGIYAYATRTEITFPDLNLGHAVSDNIGKAWGEPIYLGDVAGLTSLDVSNQSITNLSGLEYCTNLSALNLANNQVGDISPLASNPGLGEFDTVDLRGNPLNAQAFLVGIPTLVRMGVSVLYDNPVIVFGSPDLEAAVRAAIPKLTGDVTHSDVAKLTKLTAKNCQITSLDGLEFCTNLVYLDLANDQTDNITPLRSLTNLKTLYLDQNQISDITTLQSLTRLETLHLASNQISDITTLQSLTGLRTLYLANNQISDITPLQELTWLSGLYLANNQISDITPLQGLINLSILDLKNNQTDNITTLQSLTRLEILHLASNQISDITPLQGLTWLSGLYLASNQIIDITPLQSLTGLERLYLANNQISDITPVQGLINLSILDLKNNQVSELKPLVDNPGIAGTKDFVYLDGNPLDLWEGSPALADIRALEGRQVHVYYDTPVTVASTCLVDLRVVDPDGLVIDKESNAIDLASYIEKDLDGDGDLDDIVVIRSPKPGEYRVTVIPESGAPSSATFSLWFTANGTTITLADEVMLADVPGQPYSIELREDGTIDLAPIVGMISAPIDPISVNSAVSASADFGDPGVAEAHSATWEWGDGTTSPGLVTEADSSGTVTGSHTYSSAGVYTVTLTVTENDGGSGQSVYQYIVVYDPSAGFVTGGGWIDSPAGAYAADPTLTGKATFGFVAKYLKGAKIPTGQTQFQFHVAGLDFKSTSYQWLVIAGAKAQYKGSGTINGSGDHGFILSAVDGQIKGSNGVDRFRIKIWDKATGLVVYDNQMGDAEDADATTAIGGGSIVMQKTSSVATAGVSNIPYLGYVVAGLLGCFVIAVGVFTFFMWGRRLPSRY